MSESRLHCVAVSGIVPIRKEGREESEMVSQMLIGETATVRSIDNRWVEIEADLDGYKGWVSKNQTIFLKEQEYSDWLSTQGLQRSVLHSFKATSGKEARMIPVGAQIAIQNDQIHIPGFTGHAVSQTQFIKGEDILDTAIQFLGTPYLWGGRTDSGIDCSGFMQMVYLLHNIIIPRDSGPQASLKPFKSTDIKAAEPGDTIYFAFDGGSISHVGFYIGGGSLLHASASVCIQNIDYSKRFENKYDYNERLANAIVGIQAPFVATESLEPLSGTTLKD